MNSEKTGPECLYLSMIFCWILCPFQDEYTFLSPILRDNGENKGGNYPFIIVLLQYAIQGIATMATFSYFLLTKPENL